MKKETTESENKKAEDTKGTEKPAVKEPEKVSAKINAYYMIPSGSAILDQIQETYKHQKNGIFFMLLELEKRGIL